MKMENSTHLQDRYTLAGDSRDLRTLSRKSHPAGSTSTPQGKQQRGHGRWLGWPGDPSPSAPCAWSTLYSMSRVQTRVCTCTHHLTVPAAESNPPLLFTPASQELHRRQGLQCCDSGQASLPQECAQGNQQGSHLPAPVEERLVTSRAAG